MMAKYDAKNPEALRRLVAAGVQLRQFPRPVMDACYKATFETYEELSAKSADFKLVYEAWQKFLADSNLWFRVAENTLDNYRYDVRAAPVGAAANAPRGHCSPRPRFRPMSERDMTRQGVGVRVRRKEDARHLHGRGSFVSDMMLPGQNEVAFLRSPIAHGRIRRIVKPPGTEAQVFIRATSTASPPSSRRPRSRLQAFGVPSAGARQGAVRGRSGRHVRGADARRGRGPHRGDRDRVRRASRAARCPCGTRRAERAHPRGVERQLVSHAQLRERVRGEGQGRAGGDPARGRAGAPGDGADGGQGRARPLGRPFRSSSSFMPRRRCRTSFGWASRNFSASTRRARHLARRRRRLRLQMRLAARGLCIAWLALKFRRPFRYVEDRREHLVVGANSRQHHYRLTAHADERGRLMALDAEVTIDGGAYSAWPFTVALERDKPPATCRGRTISAVTAAGPIAWPPTSPAFCRIGAWREPAFASRWS